MSIKPAFAGTILVGGAVVAPFVKGETKQIDINTVAKVQEVAKGHKLIMPDWIPTTADGKFDEKKANKQAEMLWAEYGKNIQQFADNVKAGIPEKIAFNKFATKLAKGDKPKEKEILSLYDSIKKTYAKREGKMKDTLNENIPVAVLFGLTCGVLGAFVSFGSSMTIRKPETIKKITLSVGFMVAVAVFLGGINAQNTYCSQKTFVQIQREIYNEYHNKMMKNWTMTDLQTTKKMIEMAQKGK